MTIYLAGPISLNGTLKEIEIKENIKIFKTFTQILRNKNYTVLDPTEIKKQKTWEDYMIITIPMVCEANALLMLPKWELSRGANLELFIATSLNKKIYFNLENF